MPGASASGGQYNAGAPYNAGGYGQPQPPYQPFGGNVPQPSSYGYAPAPVAMPPYASIGSRLLAVIIDGFLGGLAALPGIIFIIIAGASVASTADARGNLSDAAAGAAVGMVLLGYALIFAGALGFGLYNIYLLGKTGQTIGKRMMKVKVLDQTGQPIGFWKAFARELVKNVVGNVCFLLLLWPLWDQEKQGLYDKLFSTHAFQA
jgi:uncharacterized RDD family membrane protein YckC